MLGVCDVERKRDTLATRGSNARRPVYPSPASAPAGYCHRTSIAHRPSRTSMISSTPLLRTLEFGMSAFIAARNPRSVASCVETTPPWAKVAP